MPAGDGTGPMGMGPMTGRGAGFCSGYEAPGWANPVPGRGFGLGWGRGGAWGGRGGWGGGWRHRNWYYATGVPGWARYGYGPAWGAPPAWGYGPGAPAPDAEQETEFLRQQAEWLKQQLDAIGQRIEELSKEE
ncbi:MAG: DUF5320 domain-containing protein [Anaerolineae bacterium]